MKKPIALFLAGSLLGLVLGVAIWQNQFVSPLRTEQAQLRQAADDAEALRAENARLTRERVDPDELKRLLENQSELLRLRRQVTQLRREAQEAVAAHQAAVAQAGRAVPPEKAPDESPVQSLTANVTATVAWNQGLITGGWKTPSGRRAVVLLQPANADGGAVNIKSRIVELPEAAFARFGFDSLKVDESMSSLSALLSPEQVKRFEAQVEKIEGAAVLAGPQVTTANGMQAQVAVVESHTDAAGGTYTTGPVIDVVPTISADGQSVDLTIAAQLNLPRVTGP